MEYEAVSKAYRIYDIEARKVVITRDVTFNKLSFGFSSVLPQEIVEDIALRFDALDISNSPRLPEFRQAGKRTTRSTTEY